MSNRGLLGQYAGFVSRTVAFSLDILVITVLVLLIYWMLRLPLTFVLGVDLSKCMAEQVQVGIASGPWLCRVGEVVWFVASVLAAPAYFIFFHSATGQTVGKYLLGLRVVRLDGKRMTLWGSFVRYFGLFLSAIPLGLGFFWVGIDDRRQAWHDKLVHTCVVYAWRAEQNEFFLDRLRRTLQQRVIARRSVTKAQVSHRNYDLVTIAFPEYERLEKVLDLVQDSIADKQIRIVNATVLVKGGDGAVSVLGATDLATNRPRRFMETTDNIPEFELAHIMADTPNDSFVVAIVLEEQWADLLTKTVARSGTVLIRRYDLGDNVPANPGSTPAVK